MLYNGEVGNKDWAKDECGKKIEEGIKHRVASPRSKAEGREEEGQKILS